MRSYLSLFVALLAIQTVSSQTLISVLCNTPLINICSSSALGSLLVANAAITVDVNFTVNSNSPVTLQSVSTTGTSVLYVASGSALQVSNALTVAASSSVNVAGSIVVQGSASVAGSVYIGSSSSASASAQFQAGLAVQAAANLAVYGTATVSGAFSVASNAVVNIESGATTTINSNVNNVQGEVYVSGSLVVNSGTSVSSYTQTAGSLILGDSTSSSTKTGVNANVYIDGGVVLSGTGNINGNLTLVGNSTISPGNSPGTTFVNGGITFSDTSTYKFEVDNNNNAYDRIVATGQANLNGFVHCTFLNSVPGSTSYNALVYSSRTGKFELVYGDILLLNRWHENDNTGSSTQFVYNSSVRTTFSLVIVLLGLAASLM